MLMPSDVQLTGRFNFSVGQYSQEQLNAKYDLVKEAGLHVNVDGFHMGLGDDSWTPSAKPEYLLTASRYQWAFSIAYCFIRSEWPNVRFEVNYQQGISIMVYRDQPADE